jgi:hypothetical protein
MPQISNSDNTPPETPGRPTQPAFKPASSQDLWSGAGIGLVCLVAFVAGGLAWLNPAAALNEIGAAGQHGEYELAFFLIMLTFPLFLVAAGYFFWQTWRSWRDTRAFEQGKQETTGLISQLWVDPPKGQGKKYYVGYRFGNGNEAYQQVQSRTHKRLTLGEKVKVEYVPNDPRLSRLNLRQ